MRFLLIPDKFKGSLDAKEVIQAISRGILRIYPKAKIHSVLASDGGDGFLNAVSGNLNVREIAIDTVDPLQRKRQAVYLFDSANNTAYIELAKASGLELLTKDERDVMRTSTYGTGLQIRHAIEQGATEIYLGLGGSATNDGGIGIATALGYRFLDASGKELKPMGGNLLKIATIEKRSGAMDVSGVNFYAVNDVDNPLYGRQGAAYVYAQQKGATDESTRILDEGLRNLARVVAEVLNKEAADLPGAGAAGGTAYGLNVFLDAKFISGIDFLLELAHVHQLLKACPFDYIITGEGKIDKQTLHGKLIQGVVDIGEQYKIPVIAVCGQSDIEANGPKSISVKRILEITDTSKPLQYSMDNAAQLVEDSIATYFENSKGQEGNQNDP
ncbi:glycerate kinase [Pricia sp. S334]|uniref:Glycerate kinase n=1 Tax=Pricia mediterranea TaxID=3076079 RepID=A0ABU3LAQ1_9FLAO|nr:glycerate kinase [Pricia sp. S334]MDT7830318.1 glycerate kinase [Pricia sp. S334]